MKHKLKITLILMGMFIITQLIGLAVVKYYSPVPETIVVNGTELNISVGPELPYGMQPPELKENVDFLMVLPSIILAFIIAIGLMFLLSKIKIYKIIKYWFFIVVILALGITLNAALSRINIPSPALFAAIIAIPLAFYKIFKQNFIVHNATELLIYPGIAAVFVPILNIYTAIIILIAISIYDIWAVWKSKIMIKMAKFQIQKVGVFGGFFVPYADKKTKAKIELLKQKYKNLKIPESVVKKKKIKISLAILGGGDIVFPIIASGVVLRILGLVPALIVTLFASIALLLLFIYSKKAKSYPAMPFLTAGIFAGMLITWLVSVL